jgi:hypothetical protein
MVCGREATLVKRKSFSWNPSWVWVTLLLGLLPFLIIALILTKRATVEAPLCAEHKYHWAKRTALVLLGLLVVIGVLIVAITLTSQPANVGRRFVWVWFVWLACLLSWVIAAIIASVTAIRPTVITDRDITLARVAPAFVDAIFDAEEMRHERRSRSRPPRVRLVEEARLVEDPMPSDEFGIQDKTARSLPPDEGIREV